MTAMTQDKKEKLVRFMKDERTVEAVKEVLLNSFIKPQPTKEVNYLAACRVAIDLLEEGWKELLKYKSVENEQSTVVNQVGL